MDREISQAVKGMPAAEKRKYLMDYIGYSEEEPKAVQEQRQGYEAMPDTLRESNRRKNRELFFLWMFISGEGLTEEAEEYLAEHRNDEIPFEDEL